jgi:SAM-dependent methyltransferase
MLREIAKGALRPINAGLRRVGVQIVRQRRAFESYRDYIPFDETVEAARASGMSVGDYIDTRHNVAGATQDTIDRLKAMGVLHSGVRRNCEIGPGSGRYLERTIAICHPERYEIYETAEPWRRYLTDKHDLVVQPTDGRSLASTASESVDLVHAHKVFPGLPFLVALRYFAEMARVTAPGGHVVFDMVTEACMDDETVARWLEQATDYDAYPNVLPRAYVVDFFARHGFEADAGFMAPMKPGKTECLIFRRS